MIGSGQIETQPTGAAASLPASTISPGALENGNGGAKTGDNSSKSSGSPASATVHGSLSAIALSALASVAVLASLVL